MGYRPERIVMTRRSESPRQVPIHKHRKTDEITITQIIGKEDRISALPSPPRSSWTWFMSDSTRTANVGFLGVMAPAHFSSK